MTIGRGYALDQSSPARYVATEVAGAPSGARSLRDLADHYTGHLPSDFVRVKAREKNADDPKLWLVRDAVGNVDGLELDSAGDTVRIKDGLAFEDLRYDDKPLARRQGDEHAVLGDPFNRKKAHRPLAENTRSTARDERAD